MFPEVRRPGGPVGETIPQVTDSHRLDFAQDRRPLRVRGIDVGQVRRDPHRVHKRIGRRSLLAHQRAHTHRTHTRPTRCDGRQGPKLIRIPSLPTGVLLQLVSVPRVSIGQIQALAAIDRHQFVRSSEGNKLPDLVQLVGPQALPLMNQGAFGGRHPRDIGTRSSGKRDHLIAARCSTRNQLPRLRIRSVAGIRLNHRPIRRTSSIQVDTPRGVRARVNGIGPRSHTLRRPLRLGKECRKGEKKEKQSDDRGILKGQA